jgi:hypothetical protein
LLDERLEVRIAGFGRARRRRPIFRSPCRQHRARRTKRRRRARSAPSRRGLPALPLRRPAVPGQRPPDCARSARARFRLGGDSRLRLVPGHGALAAGPGAPGVRAGPGYPQGRPRMGASGVGGAALAATRQGFCAARPAARCDGAAGRAVGNNRALARGRPPSGSVDRACPASGTLSSSRGFRCPGGCACFHYCAI